MSKHYIKDIGEVEYIDTASKRCLYVSCIICGDSVPLTKIEEMSNGNIFKVCDECKKAVMKMREMK